MQKKAITPDLVLHKNDLLQVTDIQVTVTTKFVNCPNPLMTIKNCTHTCPVNYAPEMCFVLTKTNILKVTLVLANPLLSWVNKCFKMETLH